MPIKIRWAAARSGAVVGAVLVAGTAEAQTRAECESGISFIADALSRGRGAAQRGALDKALRDARRELGEEEYDECLEAVEDAREAVATASEGRAPAFREDERLATDPQLPVSVDSAFVPGRGETEVTLGFVYDRIRRTVRENGAAEDEAAVRFNGKHRYTPAFEIERGFGGGFSGSIGAAYRYGTTEDQLTGAFGLGAKWNLLAPQDGLPALALTGQASAPFGDNNGGTYETTLGLIISEPLGSGASVPYLHANLFWTHAFNRGDDDRLNRFAGVLGLAVPVFERTALVADVLHEQDNAKGAVTNLAEIGVRQLLPGDFVLGIGTGVGFGGSSTDFRGSIALQKSF